MRRRGEARPARAARAVEEKWWGEGGQAALCREAGQGLRLGAQVKGVRSTVFWTVSIVSGLFIRDDAARLLSSTWRRPS